MYATANKHIMPHVARSGTEWSRTTVDTGQAFPNDKVPVPDAWSIMQTYTRQKAPKVTLCPSRMQMSRTGDNRQWNAGSSQHWSQGFTTYAITAGSTGVRTGGVGPTAPYATAYNVKMSKLSNGYAFIMDVLAITEPAGADPHQIQTNHCRRDSVRPQGGNVVFMDGSGKWVEYSTNDWVTAPNTGIYVTKGTRPLNGYTSYTDPFWFANGYPLRGYTKNTNP
jgi:hypothetical protein